MPMPTVAGKYFEMLKSEISAADAFGSRIIMQNANTYCTNIKTYSTLPNEGHAAINAVLRGTAALGVAMGQFASISGQDHGTIEAVRSLVLADVSRLGKILEGAEPSQWTKALGCR